MRYRHRYKIAEDYFLRMAMERGWECVPISGLLYVCEPKRFPHFRVVDHCIGVYGARVSGCFHTDRVPAKPDRRVIPWCDCCWVPGARRSFT